MPTRNVRLLLSCEHGGNKIPNEFKSLFTRAQKVLESHRGWDPGSLRVARSLGRLLGTPVHYSEVSRLLVDLNRSTHHPRVFSEFSKSLSLEQRQLVLSDYYFPYRTRLEADLKKCLKNADYILHFSIHSFTPVLNSEVRNCEIGLLYDPKQKLEKTIAAQLKLTLSEVFPDLRIRMNYPYKGVSDGLTKYLRKRLPGGSYSGIEIELNQGLLKKLEKNRTLESFSRNMGWAIEECIAHAVPEPIKGSKSASA